MIVLTHGQDDIKDGEIDLTVARVDGAMVIYQQAMADAVLDPFPNFDFSRWCPVWSPARCMVLSIKVGQRVFKIGATLKPVSGIPKVMMYGVACCTMP